MRLVSQVEGSRVALKASYEDGGESLRNNWLRLWGEAVVGKGIHFASGFDHHANIKLASQIFQEKPPNL